MMHLSICVSLQGIADLSMGEQFRELARKITQDVHGVLSGTLLAPECPVDDVKGYFHSLYKVSKPVRVFKSLMNGSLQRDEHRL